ncbi:MAG: 7TM diverse intracellular signaling domain-containing protein [Bacteroidota bacterium]
MMVFHHATAQSKAYAADNLNPVTLAENLQPYYCLQSSALFYSVENDRLSVGEIAERLEEFVTWDQFALTHEEDEIWIYFTLSNDTKQNLKFFLNGQLVDYVELFRLKTENSVLVSKSGYLVPFADRPVLDWGLIVNDDIASKSKSSYLLKLTSETRNSRYLVDYTFGSCLKLYMEEGYQDYYSLRRRLTYFFLGALFIMFLYNLFISVFTLYREYFLFSIYNISVVLAVLFITDAHLETGILEIWNYFRNLSYIFLSMIPLTFTWFAMKYLDVKKHFKVTNKILLLTSALHAIVFACLLMSYFVAAFYLLVILSVISLMLICRSALILSVKSLSARFMLVGILLLMGIGLLNLINIPGWIKTSNMVHASMTLQMMGVVVFSFAVAFKLRVSKREVLDIKHRNEIQQERIRVEESLRKQLESENNQKARSLTVTSMQLLNLNERLSEMTDRLDKSESSHQWLIKEIDGLRQFESQWEVIKTHFENVHPDFFSKIEINFPNLSLNDHRLLAFMKMKLSNKEIAVITNVTRRAVEQSKRRLKKKLGIESNDHDILKFLEKSINSQTD